MTPKIYQELYRPQFHFTPKAGWMNDPNGMVYYDGEYHLFYQFTGDNIVTFGPKSWGHAISTDLIHWKHLPIALTPDSIGDIWSGSAVVDRNNTSGLQTGDEKVLVAIFTHASEKEQQQSIAFSNDRGHTWTKYEGNPIVSDATLKDFRDPKIIWHNETESWVMILAAGDRIKFYTSQNLIDWKFASDFGRLDSFQGGVWECPDLFELTIDDDRNRRKWVLLFSVSQGGPNCEGGMQYFIGDFDGKAFTNDNPAADVNWVDYGCDSYAGVTFSDIPVRDGRRILMGWMGNWSYAFKTPTTPWRGAMTIPRELKLITGSSGNPKLVSLPVAELTSLRGKSYQFENQTISDTMNLRISLVTSAGIEVTATIEPGTPDQWGIILKNEKNYQTVIGFDVKSGELFVDRGASGLVDFDPTFSNCPHVAPVIIDNNPIRIQIFIDWSSIEVFVNNGEVVLTEQIFPDGPINTIELYAQGGESHLLNMKVWELESSTL